MFGPNPEQDRLRTFQDTMIEYDNGIHIRGTDLWFDAKRKTNFCFVSHAHADHAIKHNAILTTKETARFFEHRYGRAKFHTVEYNRVIRIRGAKIQLFPSGHILGGAQILVETGGVRIVYTGDFKLRKSWTAQKAEVKRCDILIMESTFGQPQYLFPTPHEIQARMVTFVEEARADREHPVFLAYSLGKAQEAMKILSHWRYKFSVDRSIFDICRIYEEFGIKFGDYRLLEEGHVKDRIVIVPPQAKRSSLLRDIPRKRIAMLTGWAMDPGPLKHLAGCQCIPLSDHADFSELLEYADKAKPEKIYTVHGFPELVEFLNQKGYDAEFLKQGSQPGTAFDQELPGNYDLFAKG